MSIQNPSGGTTAPTPPRSRIAVVIGSTRPTRICPGIAGWARGAAQAGSASRYDLIDLADVDLPLLDEPLMPALNRYQHEHTRAWSRTVSSYDGFIFVLPQYNWGYPAPLKNAVDYLYREWSGKPATCLTYGNHGGNLAADQFLTVMRGVGMRPLDSHIEVVIGRDDVDENWQIRDLEAVMAPYRDQLLTIDQQMSQALAAGSL